MIINFGNFFIGQMRQERKKCFLENYNYFTKITKVKYKLKKMRKV